jgi:pyridoxamine-phosphate oxidase
MTTLSGDTTLRLAEFDRPPADPIPLLRGWLDAAVAAGVREPCAMTLATADPAGRPSTRVVLLKAATDEGLIFGSHTRSRKGADLAGRPYASATFHWRETVQQIHVAGPVSRLSDAGSDRLFAERPPAARATTAASEQSRPLDNEDTLRRRAADLLAAGAPIPRPADWSGYLLRPATIEFWHGREDRLHRRLRYDRAAAWTWQRLQP